MRLALRAHDLKIEGERAVAGAAKAAGLDGVQLVCYKSVPDVRYEPGGITRRQAARIGTAFREAGVPVVLLGAYFNPVHSDLAKVDAGMAVFADYLRLSGELGCDVVASETGSRSDEPWVYHPQSRTEESLARVVDVFSRLCDIAAPCGACVAIEGAIGHVCWNVGTLKAAYERIGRENLSVVFDLYNFLDRDNCRDYYDILCEGLETFGRAIRFFHLKDCSFSTGTLRRTPLGRGELDYGRILAAIRKSDPDATLIMEGTAGGDIPFGAAYIRRKWSEIAS